MRRVLLIVLCLVCGTPAWADWPVIDIESIFHQILAYEQQLKDYAELIKQTQQQLVMVQQGIRNLQRFPVNEAQRLWALMQNIQDPFRTATQIGYEMDRVVAQINSVYPQVQGVLSGQAITERLRRAASTQREAVAVAAQVQAIQRQAQDQAQRIRDLVNASNSTYGNLDTQQAMAQIQGAMATEVTNMEVQLATQARIQALKAAQEADLATATANMLDEARGTVDTLYEPAGKLLRLGQ